MTPSDRVLLALFRRFPPRDTIFKDPEPRAATEYEDESAFGFERYFGRGSEFFVGLDVLDLGCGFGGRPVRYLERGARSVIGVEIADGMVTHARRFAAASGVTGATFCVGMGEAIPCPDRSVDLVTMNDVMEHVLDPVAVVEECHRVLRPGGRLALVFPPYFDLTGGSHLHGYATRFPGLNLLFPTRALKRAALLRFAEQGIDHRPHLREAPGDKLWNQNGLTVRSFSSIVTRSQFEVEQLRFIGHLDHRLTNHRGAAARIRRPLYWLAEAPAQLPVLQEIACMRVVALLRRAHG